MTGKPSQGGGSSGGADPQQLVVDLRAGLVELGLELSDVQLEQLIRYLGLLQKWNRVYNLTSIRDSAEMLSHHLLDSLAVVRPLRREVPQVSHLLDVGSGGGLPGAVLAICDPNLLVDCVDTVGKKAAFVQQVAGELGLRNLRGVHSRVEQLDGKYDVVTSRAFSSLADFVRLSGRCLTTGGVWMAMKGKRPDDEIAALPHGIQVFHVEQLAVPKLAEERCIVWMRRAPSSG